MKDGASVRLPEIQVAFLPGAVGALYGHAVALIDVLRTSTTVVECFSHGARAVYLSSSLEAARSLPSPADDPVILAEVSGGEARPEAAFAPSPSLLRQHPPTGRNVVICTVNGAAAAERLLASGASSILLVGLVNLEASVRRLVAAAGDCAITVVCSGYGGNAHVALDDVYVAGSLAARLLDGAQRWRPTDAARVAMGVARSYPDPIEALRASATGEMLSAIGRSDDVAACARLDVSPIVPTVGPLGASGSHVVQVLASGRTTAR